MPEKKTKAETHYTPRAENDTQRCMPCRFFIPEHNQCRRVAGEISPSGWCELFERKAAPETPTDRGNVHERHQAEREDMGKRHRGERRELYGDHRSQRDQVYLRHQKEFDDMAARHADELAAEARWSQ